MTMPAADIFTAIGSASAPLTLARAADGFLPLLLADLARASDKRLVYVATDDTAMQAIADADPMAAKISAAGIVMAAGYNPDGASPRSGLDGQGARAAGRFRAPTT